MRGVLDAGRWSTGRCRASVGVSVWESGTPGWVQVGEAKTPQIQLFNIGVNQFLVKEGEIIAKVITKKASNGKVRSKQPSYTPRLQPIAEED